MNIFIIPSWYPSASNPVYGTFNHEQARLLAEERSDWSIGVSTWGQGDERFLLPAFEPNSVVKAVKNHELSENLIKENLKEYFSPAFTWTRKIAAGNIKKIIKANEKNLERFIKDFGNPDVLSAQASYPAAIVAQHLSREYQIPYVVTIRMSPFPFAEFLNQSGRLRSLLDEPLKDATMLISTSESLRRRLQSFDFDKVEVVNNPIDLTFFRPDEKVASSHDLLVVGRIEEQKGIDILIESISLIKDSLDGKVRIVGDGSQLENYMKLAQRVEVEDKIIWLGQLSREEVQMEMQRCSFYVLSSRHETFGNVVVEAMACGKPVVATKCGGPEEILTEESGYLCEINSRDLADKILEMINKRDSFDSNLIRIEAENRFSPTKWANELEEVFRSVISR